MIICSDVLATTIIGYDKHLLEHVAKIGSSAIKSNFLPILMDDDFNSVKTVERNLLHNFLYAAMLIEIQVTEVSKSTGVRSEKGLLEVILRLAQVAVSMSPAKVGEQKTLSLFWCAFYAVFRSRYQLYPQLNSFLKSCIEKKNSSININFILVILLSLFSLNKSINYPIALL